MVKLLHLILFLLLTKNIIYSQEIVKVNGKFALMNYDREVYTPAFDTIYYEGDFAYFRENKKWKVVQKQNLVNVEWSKFVPSYDELIYLNSGSRNFRFVVKADGKYGVADVDCNLKSTIVYDSVYLPRHWIGNLVFEKNNLLAFHPVENVLEGGALRFEFEDLVSNGRWLSTFKKGNQYGFFTRRDSHAYLIPELFDSLPKMESNFISTWRNGLKTYYYSYDLLSHNTWFQPFDLEVGGGIVFRNISGTPFKIDGPKRVESCLIDYYHLFIGCNPGNNISCIELGNQMLVEKFEDPTAEEAFVKFIYQKGYTDPDSMLVLKIRTQMNDKEVKETYYSLQNLEELASVIIAPNEVTILKQCDWNYDYMAVCIQRADGKVKNPYGFFALHTSEPFRRTKPMADNYHKRGGGGGKSPKWMDALWMGGR